MEVSKTQLNMIFQTIIQTYPYDKSVFLNSP